jgi:hypothetical protein
MGSAFRTWFNQIPGNDPIEQQQAGVMQALLLALMAITVLGYRFLSATRLSP